MDAFVEKVKAARGLIEALHALAAPYFHTIGPTTRALLTFSAFSGHIYKFSWHPTRARIAFNEVIATLILHEKAAAASVAVDIFIKVQEEIIDQIIRQETVSKIFGSLKPKPYIVNPSIPFNPDDWNKLIL